MSGLKYFNQISPEELKKNGVVALSNTPNRVTTYGVGGLSAAQLKEHFDKLSNLITVYLNDMTKTLGTEGAKYIAMTSLGDNIKSLEDLATSVYDGNFASLLRVYASIGDTGTTSLQEIIQNGARVIADITDGTTIVGQSEMANRDGEGNVISRTYVKAQDVNEFVDYATDNDIDALFL